MQRRGVELEILFDEGTPIMKKGSMAINKDFDAALIGTAEKGYAGVDVSVEFTGD